MAQTVITPNKSKIFDVDKINSVALLGRITTARSGPAPITGTGNINTISSKISTNSRTTVEQVASTPAIIGTKLTSPIKSQGTSSNVNQKGMVPYANKTFEILRDTRAKKLFVPKKKKGSSYSTSKSTASISKSIYTPLLNEEGNWMRKEASHLLAPAEKYIEEKKAKQSGVVLNNESGNKFDHLMKEKEKQLKLDKEKEKNDQIYLDEDINDNDRISLEKDKLKDKSKQQTRLPSKKIYIESLLSPSVGLTHLLSNIQQQNLGCQEGEELIYVRRLLDTCANWAENISPGFTFEQFLPKIEKMSTNDTVMRFLGQIRAKYSPFSSTFGMDIDEFIQMTLNNQKDGKQMIRDNEEDDEYNMYDDINQINEKETNQKINENNNKSNYGVAQKQFVTNKVPKITGLEILEHKRQKVKQEDDNKQNENESSESDLDFADIEALFKSKPVKRKRNTNQKKKQNDIQINEKKDSEDLPINVDTDRNEVDKLNKDVGNEVDKLNKDDVGNEVDKLNKDVIGNEIDRLNKDNNENTEQNDIDSRKRRRIDENEEMNENIDLIFQSIDKDIESYEEYNDIIEEIQETKVEKPKQKRRLHKADDEDDEEDE
ncbi:MAG: hypothetical protein EZS28_002806 [Streblomastix strix]|uniref:Chromosome segregation in meiosis protein 3 domain-containing protein n=1 Tax=Streblomastix strix TaxID=222440 RepID=A0A5J4X4E9_9EUKA|nr:MAG: hypothetical protein EZS28_002806 [Streblomastix strix]